MEKFINSYFIDILNMMIRLEKPVVLELINFKLKYIVFEIDKILAEWKETSIEEFLAKAKDGRLENAENNAIELRQLIFEEKKLRTLLSNM